MRKSVICRPDSCTLLPSYCCRTLYSIFEDEMMKTGKSNVPAVEYATSMSLTRVAAAAPTTTIVTAL